MFFSYFIIYFINDEYSGYNCIVSLKYLEADPSHRYGRWVIDSVVEEVYDNINLEILYFQEFQGQLFATQNLSGH